MIHDEKKIEELMKDKNISIENMVKQYAESVASHIRKQTIEECERKEITLKNQIETTTHDLGEALKYMKMGIETSMNEKPEPIMVVPEITFAKGQVSGMQLVFDELSALNDLE